MLCSTSWQITLLNLLHTQCSVLHPDKSHYSIYYTPSALFYILTNHTTQFTTHPVLCSTSWQITLLNLLHTQCSVLHPGKSHCSIYYTPSALFCILANHTTQFTTHPVLCSTSWQITLLNLLHTQCSVLHPGKLHYSIYYTPSALFYILADHTTQFTTHPVLCSTPWQITLPNLLHTQCSVLHPPIFRLFVHSGPGTMFCTET